jgi:hypothetical protein
MKPIGPVPAVAAPASSVTATRLRVWVRAALPPMDFARSSPSAVAFSDLLSAAQIITPTTMNGAIAAATASGRPSNAPVSQNRMLSNARGWRSRMVNEMPSITAPTAMPASSTRTGVGVARRVHPTAYTRTMATSAPAKANQMYDQMSCNPRNAMAATTNRLAPELMPRTWVSASGLRATAWMTAPDKPSATPATRASTVRGMRSSCTIHWSPMSR